MPRGGLAMITAAASVLPRSGGQSPGGAYHASTAPGWWATPHQPPHVLKHEPRSREELVQAEVMPSYNAPGAALDPGTVAAIVDWLKAHA
jgi:hypothetical protein